MKKFLHVVIVSLLILLPLSIIIYEIIFWFGTPRSLVDTQKDQYVSITNGTKIYYEKQGSGPAILMIHSTAWSSIEYKSIAKNLAEKYTVYTVDLPGFGKSDKPQASYTLEYLHRSMQQFVEQFPEQQFSIVGSSLGGTLALELAADYPDRITSVALISPFGFGEAINKVALLAQVPILAEVLLFPNELTFNYVLNHGVLSKDALSETMRERLFQESLIAKSSRAKLSILRSTIVAKGVKPEVQDLVELTATRVHQPVLLLWGTQDTYTPSSQGERALQLMPQAQLKLLNNAGHFAQLEVPDEITDYLKKFYANLPPQ